MQSQASKNGDLTHLEIEGSELALPWGIETADPNGFFTSSEKSLRVVQESSTNRNGDAVTTTHELNFPKNKHIAISSHEKIDSLRITRQHTLTTNTAFDIADFVTRFQFTQTEFSAAKIGGKLITHQTSGINHMFETDLVELIGDRFRVVIKGDYQATGSGFKLHTYVKDTPGRWIVHFRLLPDPWDFERIKIAKSWAGTRPLPALIGNVLLRIPRFRERVWFGGERQIPRKLWRIFNPTAFPYKKLPAGYRLDINTIAEFSKL